MKTVMQKQTGHEFCGGVGVVGDEVMQSDSVIVTIHN